MTFKLGSVTVPHPAFRTLEEANIWCEQVHNYLRMLQMSVNSLTVEARKSTGAALTAANGGTVNSGDATTDDVIEANRTRIGEIEAILVANGLAEEA